jgi:hypothetical protein
MSFPSSSETSSTSNSTSLFCKYCRKPGHLIDACDKRKAADDRPSKPAQPLYLPSTLVSTISNKSDGLYVGHPVVPCQIAPADEFQFIPSHIVLDSGSPIVSLLRYDVAEKLGVFSYQLSQGSNDPNFVSLAKVLLKLRIGNVESLIDFDVVRNIQPPLVLSLNQMMKMGISPDFFRRIASVSSGSVEILDYYDVRPESYRDSPETYVIPPIIPGMDDLEDPERLWSFFRPRYLRNSYEDSDYDPGG